MLRKRGEKRRPRIAWALFDTTVSGEYGSLVNNLDSLRQNESYWLYATEPISPYFGIQSFSSQLGTFETVCTFPPATYYGEVNPMGTFEPVVGMEVTAVIDGNNCGQTEVQERNGQRVYSIQVHVTNPLISGDSCGGIGKEISFLVDDQVVATSIPWDNSQAKFLALGDTSNPIPPETAIYLPLISR